MRRTAFIVLLISLVYGFGCNKNTDSLTSILSVIPDENYFNLSVCAPEGGYSHEQSYQWLCTSRMVHITFDSTENSSGMIQVVFRDSVGQIVCESIYPNPNSFCLRKNISEACPGTWLISIHIINFKGYATICATAN
jgi:hypothetical protein